MITKNNLTRHLSYMIEQLSKGDDERTLSLRDKYIEKLDKVNKMSDEEFAIYLKNSRYLNYKKIIRRS